MPKAYYNEFDPFAAAWLRELISAGLIAPGDVDERSIVDVHPADIAGYTQCHFFAGIAGWAAALRLAGIGDEFPVWTGSCPCQPYSSAGKRKGDADERNLWPAFFRLIKACQPERVFGEQVEAAIRHGWLDGISADLEGEGYTVGACVLGAHSVGAPHIRQRLYWGSARVAESEGTGRWTDAGSVRSGTPEGLRETEGKDERRSGEQARGIVYSGTVSERMADTCSTTSERDTGRLPASEAGVGSSRFINGDCAVGLADGGSDGERLGNSDSTREGSQRSVPAGAGTESTGSIGGLGNTDSAGSLSRNESTASARHGNAALANGFWADSIAIACRDGKTRRIPTEPALFPLADGIPNRVGLLRGAGNAIVPEDAAEFIKAFLDSLKEF